MRTDLRAILSGCPVADETILVASELAANAVTHSGSRQPGGRFIVRAAVRPGDHIWVEVEDQGGTWAGHHPRDGRPHGLDLVQAIVGDGNWGIDGDATLGRVAWARLDWPRPLSGTAPHAGHALEPERAWRQAPLASAGAVIFGLCLAWRPPGVSG